MKKKSFQIKSGRVSVTVYNHSEGWRFEYEDPNGKKKTKTSKNLEKIKGLAKAEAERLAEGQQISNLTPEKKTLINKILTLFPTEEDLLAFYTHLNQKAENRKTVLELYEDFMRLKENREDVTRRNLQYCLSKFNKSFGNRMIDEIKVGEIQNWIDSLDLAERTRWVIRSKVGSFFNYAKDVGAVREEGRHEAEKLQQIEPPYQIPDILTPEEFQTALENVVPEFLPWIAIGGFCGLRTSEIQRLTWDDIDYEEKLITTVAKKMGGKRRTVEIPDAFFEWLPEKGEGKVIPRRPSKRKGKKGSESVRLAGILGYDLWPHNCLRHSFCTYKTHLVGAGLAALQAGNSEKTIKSHYLGLSNKRTGEKWFRVVPHQDLPF